MKKKEIGIAILFLVSALLITSCASTGFLMAKAKVTLYSDAYPPKNKQAKIDVYRTTKPTKEYLEFAQITCADTNDKWSLDQIKIKAREIGADGIIIIGKVGSTGIGVPAGNSTYVISEDYGMTAIAIKYK